MTRTGKMLLSLLAGCAVLAMILSLRSWQKSRHREALLAMTARDRGRALLVDFDCLSCHQPSSSYRAPILDGLLGRTRNLADGSAVVIDEAYLRESIVTPKAKIASGYQDVMPSFEGRLTPDELTAIVEALK